MGDFAGNHFLELLEGNVVNVNTWLVFGHFRQYIYLYLSIIYSLLFAIYHLLAWGVIAFRFTSFACHFGALDLHLSCFTLPVWILLEVPNGHLSRQGLTRLLSISCNANCVFFCSCLGSRKKHLSALSILMSSDFCDLTSLTGHIYGCDWHRKHPTMGQHWKKTGMGVLCPENPENQP